MRRASDRDNGQRTGVGRRARDRILSGQTQPSPILRQRRDLQNLVLFLGDDLRESALALGGIEGFLLEAQAVLERPNLDAAQLAALVEDDRLGERIDLLTDALSSLRRSMQKIHDSLHARSPSGGG